MKDLATKLQEIRSLADAASDGPWESYLSDDNQFVVKNRNTDMCRIEPWTFPIDAKDARLIAASRTIIPKLVSALEKAVEGLEKIGHTTDSAPTDVSGSGPCRMSVAASRNRRILEAQDALTAIAQILNEEKNE